VTAFAFVLFSAAGFLRKEQKVFRLDVFSCCARAESQMRPIPLGFSFVSFFGDVLFLRSTRYKPPPVFLPTLGKVYFFPFSFNGFRQPL